MFIVCFLNGYDAGSSKPIPGTLMSWCCCNVPGHKESAYWLGSPRIFHSGRVNGFLQRHITIKDIYNCISTKVEHRNLPMCNLSIEIWMIFIIITLLHLILWVFLFLYPGWNDGNTHATFHRSTTAQDFVGVMSGVPLALPSYYM